MADLWNLKNNDTNESIYKTENRFTDRANNLMAAKGRRGRGGGN